MMNSRKHIIQSEILQRMAHSDVFEIGPDPGILLLLFGGSGIDDEEYQRRSATLVPVFNPLLDQLSGLPLNFILVHVCAPYDIPFARFSTQPDAAVPWTRHVLDELLAPWADLPYVVSGFSGGAALALNGIERTQRCLGAATFGADAIPVQFKSPTHWRLRLRMYEAPHDRVCNDPHNARLTQQLVDQNQAERIRLRHGAHQLKDYATMEALGDWIRVATELVR